MKQIDLEMLVKIDKTIQERERRALFLRVLLVLHRSNTNANSIQSIGNVHIEILVSNTRKVTANIFHAIHFTFLSDLVALGLDKGMLDVGALRFFSVATELPQRRVQLNHIRMRQEEENIDHSSSMRSQEDVCCRHCAVLLLRRLMIENGRRNHQLRIRASPPIKYRRFIFLCQITNKILFIQDLSFVSSQQQGQHETFWHGGGRSDMGLLVGDRLQDIHCKEITNQETSMTDIPVVDERLWLSGSLLHSYHGLRTQSVGI